MPCIYGRLLGEALGNAARQPQRSGLSNREVEVLHRMSRGESIKQMAAGMRISEFTIRDYVQSAMRKIGAQHRAQAVAEAIRQGIVD